MSVAKVMYLSAVQRSFEHNQSVVIVRHFILLLHYNSGANTALFAPLHSAKKIQSLVTLKMYFNHTKYNQQRNDDVKLIGLLIRGEILNTIKVVKVPSPALT